MEPRDRGTGSHGSRRASDRATRVLHLAALSSFAIAQPVFGFLLATPTFLVARHSPPADIWALTLALLLVPPTVLGLVEVLASPLGRRAGDILHFVLVGSLLALFVFPSLRRVSSAGAFWPLLATPLAGLLGAWTYALWKPARSFLSLLSLAPLLFGGLFLWSPSMAEIVWPRHFEDVGEGPAGTETSVVFLIFDELPLTSLMNADLEIDPILFPNFARLAAGSTWFRNATAVHHSTATVVPTILTGRAVWKGTGKPPLPTLASHPHNLFTLFHDSHRLVVRESLTRLCPRGDSDRALGSEQESFPSRFASLAEDLAFVYGHAVLPATLSRRLPPVDQNWGGFRDKQPFIEKERYLRDFIGAIDGDGSDQPTLYYLHVLLPHAPWRILPSGREYPIPGSVREIVSRSAWGPEEGPTALGFQQHLLQLGFVDRMLGRLLDRLEATGLYDRVLIAVMGDHGMSFRPNEHRRVVSAENMRDVMHVPFFVKAPHQREPRVVDRNVESVDVLPTIAGALGITIPWEVDGVSGLDLSAPPRPFKVIAGRKGERFEVEGELPSEWEQLDRRTRLFGPHPTWEDVYRMGVGPELIARRAAELACGTMFSGSSHVAGLERFADVDPSSPVLPSYVWGEISANAADDLPDRVAIAVNGIVRSVTPTWAREGQTIRFGAMLPEDCFRAGRNEVSLFAVDHAGALVSIPLRPD